jgi:hypothetical protein
MSERRTQYVTDMDVEVDYSAVDQIAAEHGLEPRTARASAIRSYVRHLDRACHAALREHGQKFKKGERDANQDWSIATFRATFEGDPVGASAAASAWAAKAMGLAGTGRLLRVRLQGEDGTNLERYSETYQREPMETIKALPREGQAAVVAHRRRT